MKFDNQQASGPPFMRNSMFGDCSSSSSVRISNEDKEDKDWVDYFANLEQWWDNRFKKHNPRAPNFKHGVTKRGLWIDSWYTPGWVRERFSVESK